ncbi:MAG: SCO family protein [Acidobacteria bacterium]|nr:SCO family protein [Acidobacteriota bacterium]
MPLRRSTGRPNVSSESRPLRILLICAAALMLSAIAAQAQTASMRPSIFDGVSLTQKLNNTIPLDLEFRDENGNTVRLGEYFGSKPVVLTLVYYECPMLCTQVLNAATRGLQGVPLEMAKDYDVVTVSINPRETSQLAAAKKRLYTGISGQRLAEEGWHFLTGDEPAIQALAEAVGFHYAFDEKSGQYAHPSGIMVLTPEGRLSHYFYGVQYPSRDLRLGLVEASAGKIGSPVDQLLLFCFHYDPQTGKYGVAIMNVIRAAGLATMLGVGVMVMFLSKGDRKKRKGDVA